MKKQTISYLTAVSLAVFSEFAFAGGAAGLSGITKFFQALTAFVSGGFGILLLTIIIMGSGIALFFNKISMRLFIAILGGSFLVFGAPRIAVWIQGLFV